MRSGVIQGKFVHGGPKVSVVRPHPAVRPAPQHPGFASAAQQRTAQPPAPRGATPVEPGALRLPAGAGRPLPEAERRHMEAVFGTRLADVRIHEGPQASAIGAVAFTLGNEIHFAPGHFVPGTGAGRQLLGHEIAHVLQQKSGRVRNPLGGGLVVLQDSALEAEAERMGLRAAQAMPRGPAKPLQSAHQSLIPRVAQRMEDDRSIRRTNYKDDGFVTPTPGTKRNQSTSSKKKEQKSKKMAKLSDPSGRSQNQHPQTLPPDVVDSFHRNLAFVGSYQPPLVNYNYYNPSLVGGIPQGFPMNFPNLNLVGYPIPHLSVGNMGSSVSQIPAGGTKKFHSKSQRIVDDLDSSVTYPTTLDTPDLPEFLHAPEYGSMDLCRGGDSIYVILGPGMATKIRSSVACTPDVNHCTCVNGLNQLLGSGWIKGHLLNANLGGANTSENLTAMTHQANMNYKTLETRMKKAVQWCKWRSEDPTDSYVYGVEVTIKVVGSHYPSSQGVKKMVAKHVECKLNYVRQLRGNSGGPTEDLLQSDWTACPSLKCPDVADLCQLSTKTFPCVLWTPLSTQ